MNRLNQLVQSILRSSILWGGLASAAFYGVIQSGPLATPFLVRYTASHPIEYAETILFFVGLAVLLVKCWDVAVHYYGLGDQLLGPVPNEEQPVEACPALLARLGRLPTWQQNHPLVGRLREALEQIHLARSAAGLSDRLHWLADQAAEKLHASYGLLRVIIWAIPILGFLGTVIGITMAIANLSPEALEKSLPEVTSGLGVAFDTTALALALSMVLMFVQYVVERAETGILAAVDERASAELAGRFGPETGDSDSAAVRQMAQTVVKSTEELVRRQAQIWQQSMAAAEERWAGLAEAAGRRLEASLSSALGEALRQHAEHVAAAETASAEQNRRHWHQVQHGLEQSTAHLAAAQAELARQGEVLARAIEATGEVTRLEDALNRNLSALAGARNFEETVTSLAAAIQLLSARLGQLPGAAPAVHLAPGKRAGQAA